MRKSLFISGFVVILAVLIASTAWAAGWLFAPEPAPQSAPVPTAEPAISGTTTSEEEPPLPNFVPSERLPAGSAVAFPVDI